MEQFLNILQWIVNSAFISGSLLLVITKAAGANKVYDFFYSIAKKATKWGSKNINLKIWNSLENFIIDTLGVVVSGIKDGLHSDN